MAITHLKITGNIRKFKINDGEPIECRPAYAKKPCFPQDYFDMIEECKVCGQKFI